LVMLNNAVPFIGFGFLDNALMIICGEMIDQTLCVTMAFSTMTAAALGNMIADVCGCASGGAVERLADRLGMPRANLGREQSRLPIVTRVGIYGQMIGVFLGCCLGCFPLLCIDPNKSEKAKAQKRKEDLLLLVQRKLYLILGADRCTLFIVKQNDDGEQELLGTREDGQTSLHKMKGMVSHAVDTGKTIWAHDVYEEYPNIFNPAVDKASGYKTKSSVVVPILSTEGLVLGVLQLVNKMEEDGSIGKFTEADVFAAEEVASFLAYELEEEDDEVGFQRILNILERRQKSDFSLERSVSKSGVGSGGSAGPC